MTKNILNDLIKALSDKQYTKIEFAQFTVTLLVLLSSLTWYWKIPSLILLKLFFNWMNKQIPHVIIILTAKNLMNYIKEDKKETDFDVNSSRKWMGEK